jgi:hypothetical protein
MDELEISVVLHQRSSSEQSGSAPPKPNTNAKDKTSIENSGRGKKANEKRIRSAESDSAEGALSEVDDFECKINAKIDKLTSIVNDVAGMIPIVHEMKAAYHKDLEATLRSDSDGENNQTDDLATAAVAAAKKRRLDLQKMQEMLIKGLTPVATLAGAVGEAIEGSSDMPDTATLWCSSQEPTIH